MSKRNITYVKPEEPNFLKKLKEQIGYKEGPTVDTKREELPVDVEDYDIPDEQPTIANLDELSAEDIENYQKQLKTVEKEKKEEEYKEDKEEKEQEEGRADLSERVIFRKPNKSSLKRESEITVDDQSTLTDQSTTITIATNKKVKKDKTSKKSHGTGTLSFDFEDNE